MCKCSQSSHIYEHVKVGFFLRQEAKGYVSFAQLKKLNKCGAEAAFLAVFWTKTSQILSVLLISGGLFISRVAALEGRLR